MCAEEGATFPPCVAPPFSCPAFIAPLIAPAFTPHGSSVIATAPSPRQPCPCGSGRRYKACHGAPGQTAVALERRPFAGLPDEAEWVALREIVPAASFSARLAADGREVTVATVLPLAWPAMVRTDGAVFLALQVAAHSGDVSRDLADALQRALAAPPGSSITLSGLPEPGPRLQDLLVPAPVDVQVHDGFQFWVDGMSDDAVDEQTQASLERANAAVVPTARLASVPAAYWCEMPGRNHLRWVLPYDEEPALDALARVFVEDALTLGPDTRYVGAFRAHGLLAPVWDLPSGIPATALEEPVTALKGRLDEAVAAAAPLGPEQRDARRALLARQVTIR